MRAIDLINRAWYLSGIVPRGLKQVSAEQGTDGLFWLNQALVEKNITGRQIPYYTEYHFNLIAGQEDYFIPNLIQSDCITFTIQQIRFSLYPKSRINYQGESRTDNIQSLPVYYYEQRVNNGCKEKFYFLPAGDYPATITGRFSMPEVLGASDDLDLVMDKYYQLFLMYDLAIYLCNFYKTPVPQMTQEKWQSLSRSIADINATDLSIQKVSTLTRGGALNYAVVNLGGGWTNG